MRIVFIGTTGSGKTTAAQKAAARHKLSAIDLDDLHWLPGWRERPDDEFAEEVKKAVAAAEGRWAVSGNYSRMRPLFWPEATHVVWLDVPFWRGFWQLIRRCAVRVFSGVVICNGNRESLIKLFSKNSIVLWFFQTYWKNRKKNAALFAETAKTQPQTVLVRVRSPAEAEAWLETLA